MKLWFEVVGTLFSVIVFVYEAVHYGQTQDAGHLIAYFIGWFGHVVGCWLTIEFLRRIWRVLRRHDLATA